MLVIAVFKEHRMERYVSTEIFLLHEACQYGKKEIVEELKEGVPPKRFSMMLKEHNRDNVVPLHEENKYYSRSESN